MFYDNTAVTTGVVVQFNIFSRATDSLLWLHGRDWTAALTMDNNCWHQPQGPLWLWLQTPITPEDFATFRQQRNLDPHSTTADPQFVDPTQHDYRLPPTSPARQLQDNTSPAGALP
jgi:hypothetical protein